MRSTATPRKPNIGGFPLEFACVDVMPIRLGGWERRVPPCRPLRLSTTAVMRINYSESMLQSARIQEKVNTNSIDSRSTQCHSVCPSRVCADAIRFPMVVFGVAISLRKFNLANDLQAQWWKRSARFEAATSTCDTTFGSLDHFPSLSSLGDSCATHRDRIGIRASGSFDRMLRVSPALR